MRLGFDVSALQHPDGIRHGGAEYCRTILERLIQRKGKIHLCGFYRSDWPLEANIQELCVDAGINLIGENDFRALGNIVADENLQRFFSGVPYHLGPVEFGNAELVASIHGLRAIELPTDTFEIQYAKTVSEASKSILKRAFRQRYVQYKKRDLQKLLFRNRNKLTILVSTEHTRWTLLSQFPALNKKSVLVRYCPPSRVTTVTPDDTSIASKGLSAQNYVLLVSGSRWEKNAYRAVVELVSTFNASRQFNGLSIVVTGGVPKFLPSQVRSSVVALPYVTDEELAALYKNSFCFVYPTLNEGFGYPPLEAMAHGAPVIAAAVTSVPEVVGRGADYFDPRSTTELSARVLRIRQDASARKDLIARGAKRQKEIALRQNHDLERIVDLLVATT